MDDDNHIGDIESVAELDRVIALAKFAVNAKNIELRARALAKLNRHIREGETKLVAVTAAMEQKHAALTEHEAAIAAREAANERRETESAASLQEARDNLRRFYDHIAEADRHLRYRILSHANLLHGYNAQLQDLPDWPAIRRLVVGLPDDPPPLEREVAAPRIDAMSDMFSDPRADRHGNVFLGTLSRDVSHKGAA